MTDPVPLQPIHLNGANKTRKHRVWPAFVAGFVLGYVLGALT